MLPPRPLLLTATLISLSLLGCASDQVLPGYYGESSDGLTASPPGSGNPTVAPVTGGSGATPIDVPVAGISGAAGASGAAPLAGMSGASGDGASAGTGAGGTGASGTGAVDAPPSSPCDLTGRWIVTRREVADGLGQLQASHSWALYEIAQQGESFTVTRGLNCGHGVTALTLLGANADMSRSWPALIEKGAHDGRTGTSREVAGGCEVRFDRLVSPEGVSLPYYNDLSIPLPTPEEPATDSTPGWEDWDEDGHPGITLILSGGIAGELYTAVRSWHELSGTVADASSSFRLASDWNQSTSPLGFNGSPLLTSQGARAADASLHFAELTRLSPDQAAGDDTSACAEIRTLAQTLTPNANN